MASGDGVRGVARAGVEEAARRQQRAVGAAAWRLAELTSLEERVSVVLALEGQLQADDAPRPEWDKLMNVLWDVLLPELSGYAMAVRAAVQRSVRAASDPEFARKAVAALQADG